MEVCPNNLLGSAGQRLYLDFSVEYPFQLIGEQIRPASRLEAVNFVHEPFCISTIVCDKRKAARRCSFERSEAKGFSFPGWKCKNVVLPKPLQQVVMSREGM